MHRIYSHLAVLSVLCVLAFQQAQCVQFDIPSAVKKCVYEEYSGGMLVKGKYFSPQDEQSRVTLELAISDSAGTEVHTSQDNQGTFAFTTDGGGGVYLLCFRHVPGAGERLPLSYNRRVSLEIESGVETTDFSKIAREEHLSKLEVEALKIQRNLEEVVRDLQYFKRREERHRDTNESTNSRVLWFSVISMVVIVCIGVWQLMYLRRFFAQKKLL